MKRRIEQRIVLKQVKVSMLEQDLSKYVTDFNITIKGV
jgi:hypothetical protein